MKKIKIGIIGAGRIGRVHANALTNSIPQAEVVAISDTFAAAAEKAAADFGIPHFYADYQEILKNPEIDAVLVCSPTNTHAQITIEAANAGKHVFCEKPVDLKIERILDAKAAAEKAGIKLQIGFNRRFDHNFNRISQLARAGALGELQVLRITSRDPEPPSAEYAKNSGGMFLDMTIHDFDMAYFLANSEVEEVFAATAVTVDPAIGAAGDIDTAVITLRFANGAIGVIDNCRKAAYGYDQRVEYFGTKGAAVAENDRETNVSVATAESVSSDKPLYFFLERYMQSFREELCQFIDAIENDKPVPVNIDDGLRPIRIAIAAKKSSLENRPVRLSEIE